MMACVTRRWKISRRSRQEAPRAWRPPDRGRKDAEGVVDLGDADGDVHLILGLTARNGHRNRFHAPMKVMIASAVVMPQFIGR